MKWTYDWLKDYLNTTAMPAEISAALTRIGLEIEDLTEPVYPIAAKIVECDQHPDSDHLHVLQVNDGSGVIRQVVCGAPNARVGLVSALAVPGTAVGGMEIKSGKIRGVLSDGMMCSGKEIGINNDHDGIIELDAATQVLGQKISALRNAPSAVFDAGITPNRPDYLAVRGIARDLAAAGVGTYIEKNTVNQFQVKSNRSVHILNEDACPTYRFCEIHGIKNNPSNSVVSARLSAIGINPKNAAIDATNYICYDLGQPMHCFDADEIRGDITVRMAENGEKFTDLFGNEHALVDTDLVIADDAGILALAGVIGGARGMTDDKTTNVILESAYFAPVGVRKTSKRLGISTDASYRYERGIDPTITGVALAAASGMITDACGGEIVGVCVAGRMMAPNVQIEYSPNLFLKKTGIDLAPGTQKEILESLDFVVRIDGQKWIVYPTPARVDIQIPENIVAELIRLYGYDKIESRETYTQTSGIVHQGLNMGLKKALCGRGLTERVSFGFGGSVNEGVLSDKPSILVANPITTEMDTARNGLLGNMLDAVLGNEKRGYPDLNLFEIGTVFDGDTPGQQHNQIVIVRTGDTSPKHWQRRNRPVDVFDIKADLISLMAGQKFTVHTDNPPMWAHPFRYGAIMQGPKKIAEFGELHPLVVKHWKLKTSVMVGLVDDLANLPTGRAHQLMALGDFQPITRDFAFITDEAFPAEKIIAAARSADNRITDIIVFDSFDMGDGKKSIAFTITILPTENMSDADLLILQNSVIAVVEKNCPAKIRDR